MAGKEIDDNPFKHDVPPVQPDNLCLLGLSDSQLDRKQKLAIITEKPGQPFDIKDNKYQTANLIEYSKSSLEAKLYQQCAPATVQIAGAEGRGSGFIIDKSGLVLSCAHVDSAISGTPYVRLFDNRIYKLKRLASDSDHDLTVYQIDGGKQDYPFLKLADLPAKPNARTRGIGHPCIVSETCLSSGRIAKKDFLYADKWAITLQEHAEPGDSGRPELNDRGEVVAVLDAGICNKLNELDANNRIVKTWDANDRKHRVEPGAGHTLEGGGRDENRCLAIKIEYVKALRDSVLQVGKAGRALDLSQAKEVGNGSTGN